MNIFYTQKPVKSDEYLEKVLREKWFIPSPRILRTRNGKPYLENAPLYFNLSHTKLLTAVAVSKQGIGLDVEDTARKIPPAVARRLTDCEKEEDFFAVWTAKEAYIKLLGDSLAHRYSALEYKNKCLYSDKTPINVEILHRQMNNYLFCVCTFQKEPLQIELFED